MNGSLGLVKQGRTDKLSTIIRAGDSIEVTLATNSVLRRQINFTGIRYTQICLMEMPESSVPYLQYRRLDDAA